MHLGELRIQDVRNLAQVQLSPGPRATVVYGENGQGKTNVLEALYLLATLKALRAGRLAELVRFEQERGRVAGDFTIGGARREISVQRRE
jgi:DNA replication and repair protein RecF